MQQNVFIKRQKGDNGQYIYNIYWKCVVNLSTYVSLLLIKWSRKLVNIAVCRFTILAPQPMHTMVETQRWSFAPFNQLASIEWAERERDVPKPTPYHHRVRQPFIKLSRNDSHNEKYVRSLISITIIDRVHNGCGLKSSWGTKVKGKHIHLWLDHQLEDIEDVPLLNSFYL